MSSRSAQTTTRAFVLAGGLIKSFIGTNRTFHILSGRLKGKKWIIGAGHITQVAGIFKEAKMDKFDKLITESSVVYDVGAHNGWYTLIASELVGPNGKVIAFEPLPRMAQYLKKHVEMNHCNNVQVIEAAVSDNDGTDTFFATKDGKLGAVSMPGLGHTERSTVKTIKLDSLVNNRLAPPPDYVKINIEGGELRALNGAASTLADFAPIIFLATHSYDLCVACSDLLISKGYKLDDMGKSKHTRECIAQKK
jgi:FkbM family methyltransferase